MSNTPPLLQLPRYATLSSLPDELLKGIIDLSGDVNFRMPPLTKRLLAYYRQQTYQEVKIKTPQKVVQFIRSISSNSGLGALVKILDIEIPKSQRWNQVEATPMDHQKAFASFKNLVDLHIIGSNGGCEAMLVSKSKECAPNLKRLYLDSAFSSYNDPFAVANFVEISKRRKLVRLVFVVQRETISTLALATLDQPLTFPSLSTYILRGPLSSSSSSQSLVAAASSPSYLKLVDTSKSSDLSALLASAEPSKLKTLVLGSPISIDPQDITKQLSRFDQLSALEVIGSACPIGRPFYTALRKLPLVKLTLGQGADVSAAEVKSLITGKRKHSSLKEVVLENIAAKYGEDEPIESRWDHDYVLPKFTKKFTKKGLEGIIEAAGDQKDVKLSGCTAEAIDILEYFNEQLEIGKEKADTRAYWKDEGHSDGDFEEYYSRCC